MRLRAARIVAAVGIALSGQALAATAEPELIEIAGLQAAHPEIAVFVAKVQDVLQKNGRACAGITHGNAFPVGAGLRVVVQCAAAGPRYEILFEGASTQISQVQ